MPIITFYIYDFKNELKVKLQNHWVFSFTPVWWIALIIIWTLELFMKYLWSLMEVGKHLILNYVLIMFIVVYSISTQFIAIREMTSQC